MWQVIGHQRATRSLEQALSLGRLAGAYLIVGPPNLGKTTLATDLACAVNCLAPTPGPCGVCSQCRRILSGLHPDVTRVEVEPGRRTILVAQIDELLHSLSLRPFEGGCRVAIIPEAGRITQESSNTLLKTLEEPSADTLLILCATDAEAMLPTIRSRCHTISLQPVGIGPLAEALSSRGLADADQAQAVAAFSEGRPGLALRALREPELLEAVTADIALLVRALSNGTAGRIALTGELAGGSANAAQRDSVLGTLNHWLQWWRDAMLHAGGGMGPYSFPQEASRYRQIAEAGLAHLREALGATQTAMRQVEQNANPRLVLDVLLVGYPRL